MSTEFLKEVHAESRILISESELKAAIAVMAGKVRDKMLDKHPIVVCCMNGGMLFTAETVQHFDFPMQMDYVHATRYRNELSGGQLHWLKLHTIDPSDRTIIILDDILDGGITLAELKAYYLQKGAKEVCTAVMLDKTTRREPGGLKCADFKALDLPDYYVYGFGLDYHGYWRNVPNICAVAKQHMV